MDIFKFTNPNDPTKMEQGEIVNNLKSKMWVERYSESSEFTFTASADSQIKEILPIGTFVSHTNTREIMVVENHEISDSRGSETDIVVTGRGFETFLETEVIGANQTFPVSEELTDYILSSNFAMVQAASLLDTSLFDPGTVVDPNNLISHVGVTGWWGYSDFFPAEERHIPRGTNLYEATLNLLAVDNFGFRSWRPLPPESLFGVGNELTTGLVMYRGEDRRSTILFSFDSGEIESADYLWSNKNYRNAVLVSGKWVETVVLPPGTTGYNRKWTFLSATDIDEGYSEPPTGGDLTAVVTALQQRGAAYLQQFTNVKLIKAEISKDATKHQYRVDYDLGDLVKVNGDYDTVSDMMITEFVEIEDETGEVGYPTLTLFGD